MKVLAAILMTAVAGMAVASDEQAMVTRSYIDVVSSLESLAKNVWSNQTSRREFIASLRGGAANAAPVDVKELFEQMGVTFPPGSSAYYNPSLCRLTVRNTMENLWLLQKIEWAVCAVPDQVEIDMSFVSFNLKLVEDVARKSDRAAPTSEEIIALWRDGKGRLVTTSKSLTLSGTNTITKGVGEVIYPTEFESSLPPKDSTPEAEGLYVVPGSFETRETGMIANIVSAVAADAYTIELTLVPEFCELLGQDDVGISKTHADRKTTAIHLRQPRFYSRNITTSVVMWDGRTLVVGAMPNSDGTEITYLFLSARLVDPAGNSIRNGTRAGSQGSAYPPHESGGAKK